MSDAPAVAQPASPAQKPDEPVPAASAAIDEPKAAAADEPKADETDAAKPDQAQDSTDAADKPEDKTDVDMKDTAEDNNKDVEPKADDAATPADKSKAAAATARRKSVSDTKKKLNKKASRARITHIDAKPGDYFFIKLKGYPRWPGIICDEEMLPQTLIKTRPVTAARPDGTYREDFADGGKQVNNRTFPVMYLHTNEFGWIPNTDLEDLDQDTVASLATEKMRKDLQAAHHLAAEKHDLQYFKDLLIQHQESLDRQTQAAEAKAAAAAAKKTKKTTAAKGDDDDVEMANVSDEYDAETPAKEKKIASKKRKAEDDAATPARSDSVKKPKIKLTTSSTPKAANGTSTPKSAKPAKPKSSKKPADKAEKEPVVQQEPELSPEDRLERKQKEVLYLRHKLQKGLLTRDQEPKETEMKAMSEFIDKLENFPDLEVDIIRATKINKVLKAILKLKSIPKEEEFMFKARSFSLLDKWNKLLAADAATGANGVNGTTKKAAPATDKTEKGETPAANGVKENGDAKEATPKTEEAEAEAVKSEEPEAAKEDGSGEDKETKTEDDIKPEETKSEAVEAAA